MSKIETILSRMMREPDFAEAVFTNAERALADYNPTPEEYAAFKALSRAEFDAQAVEGRKSMAIKLPDVQITSYSLSSHG